MLVLSDRLLITYGKKINSPRPLLDLATSDTTPRVSTLFSIVSCFETVALLLGDCSALCSRPMPQKFWSINIWRLDDVKATLRCHAQVNRSVHRGSVATSTTLGLILPVLGFALCQNALIGRAGTFRTMDVKLHAPILQGAS